MNAGGEGSSAEPSPLEGVSWVLVAGLDVEGWEEVAPTATFEDGRVAGSTGCNRFTGNRELSLLDADEIELLRNRAVQE